MKVLNEKYISKRLKILQKEILKNQKAKDELSELKCFIELATLKELLDNCESIDIQKIDTLIPLGFLWKDDVKTLKESGFKFLVRNYARSSSKKS